MILTIQSSFSVSFLNYSFKEIFEPQKIDTLCKNMDTLCTIKVPAVAAKNQEFILIKIFKKDHPILTDAHKLFWMAA